MTQKRLATTRSVFVPFKDWPIAAKLLLLVLVPLILILAITLFLAITGLNRLETETSAGQLQQEVKIIRQQIADVEASLLLNTNELTANPVVLNAIQADDLQTLKGFLLSFSLRSGLSHVQVVDVTGQTLFVNRSIDLGQTPPELQRLHNLGLLDVTDATDLIPTPSGWLLTTVRSVKLPSGEILGALSIGRLLDNTTLAALNFERTNPSLVVFDTEGQVINASEVGQDAEAGVEPNLAQVYELDRNLWAGASTGETLLGQGQVRGESGRVAYVPLVVKDQTRAVFGVVLSTAQTSALRNQLALTNLGAAGVLGLLTILIVLFLGRRYIVRPITTLASGTEQIAAGQLEVILPELTGRDELGQLTSTFNNMTNRLQQTLRGLEDRTQRLEIITNMSEHLVAILDLQTLLLEVVNQIKNTFVYYHVHIYLLDAHREKLVVAAGTGVAGAEMKAKGHAILLAAPRSLVARVARSGEIVRVDNVREAEDWLPNPLLPDTYSEMAVPVILEGEVVGVLDVQQDKIAGLGENDAYLLRTLANQLAVGIRNARLFEQVETALAKAYAVQERYTEKSWEKTKIVARQYHYRHSDAPDLSEATRQALAEAKGQVLQQNRLTAVDLPTNGSVASVVISPVVLHNRPIGALQIYPASEGQTWTEDDLAVIAEVTKELAQVAENLRLFEATREQASRERVISEITEKMRQATNLEQLVKTTTQELGRHFSAEYALMELGLEATPQSEEVNGRAHQS